MNDMKRLGAKVVENAAWLAALPLDRQEVAALVPLFKAASECAQRWGWSEERAVLLLRVCWRWVATGKIEEPSGTVQGEVLP